MSEKKTKKDPLLGDEAPKEPDPPAEPAKAEAEPVKPAPRVLTPAAQIKADAIAKFPKDIVAQTKYILDNSEKVNFIVPKIEGEIGEETVQINGYKLTIQKNVMVSIPIQIANLLAEKYRIQMTAGQDKKIDRASDVSDALN